MWEAHEGMGWWMAFGMVFWVLLAAAFIYLLSRAFDRGNTSQASEGSPLWETPTEIAQRRLASGEISEDEFDRIVEKLRR